MTSVTALAPAGDGTAPAQRMKLRYGFNEIDGWAAFSLGNERDRIHRRLRLMDTSVIRVFVFDKPVPDPFKEWHWFAAVLQAVLDSGAKPMVTFAKFPPPFDDADGIRKFVARCSEIVWGCLEQWGGQEVGNWYWCIWNEPNNPDIGGDVTYAQYRRIFEATGEAILELIEPHLAGRKARIGGPSIDGTQRAFWMDWIADLVTDFDDRMLGFVNWHMYADWRPAAPSESMNVKLWGAPDSPNGELFQALAMAQTPQYAARAQGVARLLQGRDVLNVCGELNTVAHHEQVFTQGLNQNVFGGAYYASALIHLIRGGADLEMRWTATSRRIGSIDDAYGLMSFDGEPTPACLAKQLFAQHVRYGDWIGFPDRRPSGIDAILAWNDAGRRSVVFVNATARPCKLTGTDLDGRLTKCTELLWMDKNTQGRVAREPFEGTVCLDGYGVAVATNASDTEVD